VGYTYQKFPLSCCISLEIHLLVARISSSFCLFASRRDASIHSLDASLRDAEHGLLVLLATNRCISTRCNICNLLFVLLYFLFTTISTACVIVLGSPIITPFWRSSVIASVQALISALPDVTYGIIS